ncbi:cysteine desulfurase [Boudabousia tangfeifanii]|uniref:cysteine desulfurase n=1 Tax=Boudabousia tangfeifanii TaxID=1912795 RepID=A0A1D9MKQ2_9ACTO|nr:SufS family cysteine desulfurase [Boudabousia tangfeifanii]AOZ72808.1 cysteine desulfurase [Boudabousia tangfeifanii]
MEATVKNPNLGQDKEDLSQLRKDFPILSRIGRGGSPIAYLDSAATAQKPQAVLSAVADFDATANGAVNRGTHLLGDDATEAYENARAQLAAFFGTKASQIAYTRNATEALNLIALSLSAGVGSGPKLQPGDEVCVTRLEHHANLVPWQQACARSGAKLVWLEATPEGRIDLESLDRINERTKVVAFTHASNVTGAISPVSQIVERAKHVGAITVLDACQSAPHLPLDLPALGVDFAAMSAHKMYGPGGIGAWYAKDDWFNRLDPVLTGGAMVTWVEMESATFHEGPQKFEAGTMPVAAAVGWAAALKYLSQVGWGALAQHESDLGQQLLEVVAKYPQVKLLGSAMMKDRLAVVSFAIKGIHPHDVGQIMDSEDVAIRVGHHCAIPIHTAMGVRSSSRASVAITTTSEEIERFDHALAAVLKFFGGM